jgi:hypothetical protein
MTLKFFVRYKHAARVQLRVGTRERSGDLPLVDVAAVQAHRGHEAQLRVPRSKRIDSRG